jgi:hypothetical protein
MEPRKEEATEGARGVLDTAAAAVEEVTTVAEE